MPVALQWEPHGVVREFTGTVEFEEYMQSVASLQNDARFDTLRYIIEDFSACSILHVSESDMDMVIASAIGAAFSNPHIRIAAVAQAPQARHLIHLFAQGSPFITRLFAQMERAREWVSDGDTAPVPLDVRLQATTDFDQQPLIY